MPNVDELLDGVSQIVTANAAGTLYFTVLDIKYAYSQLKLTAETSISVISISWGDKQPVRRGFLQASMVWRTCQRSFKKPWLVR